MIYIYIYIDILLYIMIYYNILWYIMIYYDILWYIMIYYDIRPHSDFIWLSRVWPALILAMAVQRGSAAVVSWFCRLDPTHPAQLCLCQAVELHRNALNAQPQKHSRPLRRFRFEFQVVHDKIILKNAHFEICKKMFTPGTSNYFSGFSGLG